ncbi:MAG: CoA transferase [Sphingomonadales bacterium]|nr:CoA transferase [Sphingomonadales bacterium]
MSGPLDHLVVVELAGAQGAAMAAMLLADHGARVIKVEPTGGDCFAADLTRKGWDRGKRSVEIDLPHGLDALRDLLRGADIFLHALDDAETAALGLDEAALERDFPALVSCRLTAYGTGTPDHGRPYGESLVAARLGTMVDKGSSHRPGPMYLGHPALHYGQAFLAAMNVLAGVRARRSLGTGQSTEASLMDAFLAQSPMNHWWQEDGISYIKKGDSGAVDRFGNVRLVTGMFECGDGKFLQIHTGSGGFKPAFDILGFGDRIQTCKGLEMAVPLTEDEYRCARVEIFDAFKARPRDEWIALMQAKDVAVLPVLEPGEILLDEQVEFANMRIAMPDADFGTIHQAAPAMRFAETPCSTPTPAPVVGADNAALPALRAAAAKVAGPKLRDIRRPLEGVRVVDFSSFFAVGFGGRLLNDLGADVIKVETPSGDQMRPLPDVFDASNRGKRDVVIDLKSPEGLEAARRLVATADVVTHNLRPGKADKLGIGYEALKAIKPDLVYLYLPGYGSKGPKSLLKAFAPLISGWVGLLYEVGGEGNQPNRSAFGNEDYNNGFLAAIGVMMALENRDRKGTGEYTECPQLHSSLWTTSEHFLDADMKPVYGLRTDREQQGFHALDRFYRTADGWVCISCRQPERYAKLAAATGLPDDERFATVASRTANDDALKTLLDAWFAAQTSAQAFATLDAAGVAAEIVNEAMWIDEALWFDWMIDTNRVVENKDSMYGHVREYGLFNRLSKTPGFAQGDAPRLGEHTRAILGEAGYSAAEIDDLIARRIAIQAANVTDRIDSAVNA